VKNHKHESLWIYKQCDQTQKETQDHSDQEGETRAPMPPMDKNINQLSSPSLEKENMSDKVISQEKLNTEDKTPHN
jgi:hypothetical protein